MAKTSPPIGSTGSMYVSIYLSGTVKMDFLFSSHKIMRILFPESGHWQQAAREVGGGVTWYSR
jgi:hypothetical protein